MENSRVFYHLGIRNGVLLIQAFVENDEFYVYDPGFRLQGEAPHILLNEINGFDHRKMLINFALTGVMEDAKFPNGNDCYLGGKIAATLWFLLSAGKIQKIDGMKNHDSRVIYLAQRLHEGDVVTSEMIGTEKQVLARYYLVCNTIGELKGLIKKLRDEIKVFDEFGKDMLIKINNFG